MQLYYYNFAPRMKKIGIVVVFAFAFAEIVVAQDSKTTAGLLDEIVVTATRSERKLSNIAVPTTIITEKRIKQSGSLRLDDILSEQTGLFITQNFGKGVQMQGLSSDYTLILLNGEPLIGRTGGVLNLSRMSVGNIKKIEIVKGPSSSLYGSEALAGVINIITEQIPATRLNGNLRYGRFNTIDGSLNASTVIGKLSAQFFINHLQSDGYSILPHAVQKTVEPFTKQSYQLQTSYALLPTTKLNLLLRYNPENIQNSIAVQNLGQTVLSTGKQINSDWNINPTIVHHFNTFLSTQLRGYASLYKSAQHLDVKNLPSIYNDVFQQGFYRIENQTDYSKDSSLHFTAGGGLINESVRSNRYDSLAITKYNAVQYFFVQSEWQPIEKIHIIGGLRYDNNSNYASVWSPKLAIKYQATPKIGYTASVGRGFKAPDFRQLYLNFTNVAAGSYSVFGSLVAKDEISRLQALQQIENVTSSFPLLSALQPETSTGWNAGVQYQPSKQLFVKLNVFRNDINNLIVTDVIAYKKNGGQIFSYLNIARAFTEGIEADINLKIHPQLSIESGYQFLITADKDILSSIRAGTVFTRDLGTGISRKLARNEYAGLSNRSKHTINIKLFGETADAKWFATSRAIWRSRFGTSDVEGNGIINRTDEFAKGFVLINASAGRRFSNGIQLMAGIDNIFNYKDAVNLPGLPGISGYCSMTYNFLNHTNK
jgi:outer membrane receptor for ferrienterochelin and colicins